MKRSILFFFIFILIVSLASCSYNPFSSNNHLTGNVAAPVAGGLIGGGSAALLGASKPVIALAGIGGAALGYYVSTLDFAAGGIKQVGGQVYTLGDYATIEIPTDQIFEDNSSYLLPEAYPALQSAVEILKRYPNSNIMVSGNTSGFGTERFERKLSEARAREVAGFLWANGVNAFKAPNNMSQPTRKLIYVGYGNYFPIANNIRANSIRQNSRIQITAFPCKADLKLSKSEKIFANIGGLNEAPINADQPEQPVVNSFQGDLLPDNESEKPSDSFSESAPSQAVAPIKNSGFYEENNASSSSQTFKGASVEKQGGFRRYKGE